MENLHQLLIRAAESVNAAQAHYQIWFTLRGKGKALEKYYDDMNDYTYVDFFHAINAGTYKLIYIELGCLFDPDDRTASMKQIRTALTAKGRDDLANKISNELAEYKQLVGRILTIRSKLMAHKENGADSDEIHSQNGITPNELGRLIRECSSLLNRIHGDIFGQSSVNICLESTNRFENATFNLLNTLQKGRE